MLVAATIETRAVALAQEFDIYSPRGTADLKKLVSELNGEIEITFDTVGAQESMNVSSTGQFKIILPWNNSHTRDRWTIAHELGHLALHFDPKERMPKKFRRYGLSRDEHEANAFAAAILMPADHFRREYTQLGGDLIAIADHFGVSITSARMRATSFGLG